MLEEAFKKTNPIMERCNFLSITASNLDEFFMVRVAGVLDQIHHGRTSRDASGMTPTEVMDGLVEKNSRVCQKAVQLLQPFNNSVTSFGRHCVQRG